MILSKEQESLEFTPNAISDIEGARTSDRKKWMSMSFALFFMQASTIVACLWILLPVYSFNITSLYEGFPEILSLNIFGFALFALSIFCLHRLYVAPHHPVSEQKEKELHSLLFFDKDQKVANYLKEVKALGRGLMANEARMLLKHLKQARTLALRKQKH